MLFTDLRHAARALLRTPSFTMLAIGTLALGVGASTAIFSALYRLQFAPLPFETSERLVNLARTQADQGFFISPQPEVVRAWQEHATTLEQVALIVHEQVTLTGAGEPVELNGARVSPQIADMLHVSPLIGRMLTAQDAVDTVARVLSQRALTG